MSPRPSRDECHIVLIGMRGSGKSTVGRLLAAALGLRHIDTDDLVMRASGRTVAEVFAAEGETGFRRWERESIAAAVLETRSVISLGGGAVLDANNVCSLQATGFMVWLRASVDVLRTRIEGDVCTGATRPALTVQGGPGELATVLSARESLYRDAADLEIETDRANPDEVVSAIVAVISVA